MPVEHAEPYVKSFDDETVEVVEPSVLRYLNANPNFILEAGGVGVLSYSHGNVDEPALCLSGGFSIPPADEV